MWGVVGDGRDEDAEHGLDDDEDVDALEQRPKKRVSVLIVRTHAK